MNPKNTKKKKKNNNNNNNNNVTVTVTLPHELTVEILLRLPVRSLLRFKTVCKSWLSLISDPQFAKSHSDLDAVPSNRLLCKAYPEPIMSIGMDSSLHSIVMNKYPLSPPCPDECFVKDAQVLGSCRGFVLLHYETGEKGFLFIWNPLTGSSKQIPGAFFGLTKFFHYGFGYDASTDDYLVVLLRLEDRASVGSSWIEFYSVKTNTWNFIRGINSQCHDVGFRVGSLLNGAIHWLVFSYAKNVPVIIAFDLTHKTLSGIPLPQNLTMESECKLFGLRVLGGCLSVQSSVQGDDICEIWVMRDYKVQSSWTKSFVLSDYFSPLCISNDGGILGTGIHGRLEKYDNTGELLEHVFFGLRLMSSMSYYPNDLQPSMYRESLLSLPQVSLGK